MVLLLKLFKMLLDKDLEKVIVKEQIKTEIVKGIAPKLFNIIESLPNKTGVYYIHKENGTIIFIGKSRNIKKRVNQHFTGITKSALKIQQEVFTVTYEETGSELIALLKESEEIKRNRPIYNRMSPKSHFPVAIYSETDANGYLNLKLQKADGRKKEIIAYTSLQDGKNTLFRISSQYSLCQKLTGLYETKAECFQHKINECDGACIGKVLPEEYNKRVQDFIDANSFENQSMIILDKGRTISERSAILIENGIYKGYAYYDLNYQISNIEILKNIIIPMPNNRDTRNNIQGYLRKNKVIKIVKF